MPNRLEGASDAALVRALIEARMAGVKIVGLIGGRAGCYGGGGLIAGCCSALAVSEQGRISVSGPEVIETNRGDRMKARFVAQSNGPLNRPKLPGIPGGESFAGHSFHTSRWDYAYTGGDANGNLTGLRGKDVVLSFVESYGRNALENPKYAPQVDAVLDASRKSIMSTAIGLLTADDLWNRPGHSGRDLRSHRGNTYRIYAWSVDEIWESGFCWHSN